MMGIMNASTPLSGMVAGFLRMQVSADNLARRNVPNAEKNRVAEEAVATGGVEAHAETVPIDPRQRTTNPDTLDPGSAESTNIDVADELVQQIIARVTVGANLSVTRTAFDLQKHLLDLKV